ncbi:MAG: hypothetical protein P8105_10025, partial [Dehalococcoidia bacterium]
IDPSDLASVYAESTAAVNTVASVGTTPTMDVLYDGAVTLTSGDTFDVTAYNSSLVYTISRTTPLGALDVAATTAGFTYGVTDKRWTYDSVLLLDNVDSYLRHTPGDWYAYVNDVYKDGYGNTPDGLNVIELADGDTVEFYYAADVIDPSDLAAVEAAATAAVKTVASIETAPTWDQLFEGEVALTPGATFDVTAYNADPGGTTYAISETTPLGALDVAATTAGFTYAVSDKKMASMWIMLLDDIDVYTYDNPGEWLVYVNDVYKDGFADTADAINNFEVGRNERVLRGRTRLSDFRSSGILDRSRWQ